MNIKKLLSEPIKLISIIGILYIFVTTILNIFTGFSFEESIYPYSKIISYSASGIAFLLYSITLFFCRKILFYYLGTQILIFSNLYTGNIYIALFISSLLLVLMLAENREIKKINIIIYAILEVIKLLIVFPFGISQFLHYGILTLFSLCTIGCVNLLFRHAYAKSDNNKINIEDYKLSERQKDCIKEIVLNNTTIKALAINHNVSESAIKKDLTHIYNSLGIEGKADLKALFIDYKF